MDFSSKRKSRTVQRKVQKTKRLEMMVVSRRTEKKRIGKKTKTRVLRTGYLIKRFNKYKRSSRKYCSFALYYWTTYYRTTSIRALLLVVWPF
jgi:hypothetical protein